MSRERPPIRGTEPGGPGRPGEVPSSGVRAPRRSAGAALRATTTGRARTDEPTQPIDAIDGAAEEADPTVLSGAAHASSGVPGTSGPGAERPGRLWVEDVGLVTGPASSDAPIDRAGPVEEPSTRRARRWWSPRPLAPPAHPVMRWGVPALLILLGLAVAHLALDAKDLVLNSRDGAIAHTITDPNAPGFSAEVVPTSTLLVMHTSDAGRLVGVALMSLVSGDGGGTVAVFNEDLIVNDGANGQTSLGQIYERRGPDALKQAMTRLIDADVDAVINVGSAVLEELIRPVAPLQYTLRDNVRTVQNGTPVVALRSGPVSISTVEQVRAATEVLGPDEATVNRVGRQVAFWEAWFAALRAVPDKASVLPVYDSPIVRFATSLGTGSSRVLQAPFDQITWEGAVLHLAKVDATRELALQMIPYPKGYEPGTRLAVELRNGTGDLTRNDPLIADIVRYGGELVLLGNTDAFGVVDSTVVFYDEALRSRVESFARSIGISNVVFTDRPGSSIEVTVTIGADYTP